MAEYWLREPTRWRSLKNGTILPVDEEPPAGNMYVGMFNTPEGETEWLATEATWGGVRSGIARSYSPGLPSTAPATVTRHYGKRASWHSVKSTWSDMASGANDAAVTSFLSSIPADHELMLTYAHEPENDGVTPAHGSNPAYNAWVAANAPIWRAAQVHFYDLVKSVRPQTLVGPVLMDWTFDTGSARNYLDWTPPADKMDFFGLDSYQPYKFPMIGAPLTWSNWPLNSTAVWQSACDSLGVPGAFGEIACHEYNPTPETADPTRKVQWIQAAVNYALAHNHVAFCYFNTYKPNDTAEAMLLNSSPQSLAAWGAILSANQKGVKT